MTAGSNDGTADGSSAGGSTADGNGAGNRKSARCRKRCCSHSRRHRRGSRETRSLGRWPRYTTYPPPTGRPQYGSSWEELLKDRKTWGDGNGNNGHTCRRNRRPRDALGNLRQPQSGRSATAQHTFRAESRRCYRRACWRRFTMRQGRVEFRQIAGPITQALLVLSMPPARNVRCASYCRNRERKM